MIRRPPRSTRTDTLFPYTTLFRSQRFSGGGFIRQLDLPAPAPMVMKTLTSGGSGERTHRHCNAIRLLQGRCIHIREQCFFRMLLKQGLYVDQRSEERRVGKECGSTFRSRWSPERKKKKKSNK